MATHLPARRWQDRVILLLGLWLFASPWAMGYPSDSPPAVNAFVAGAIMRRWPSSTSTRQLSGPCS